MAIKGVTRSNWDTPLPPTSNICASQKNKNPQNTTDRITKSIHPRVVEGRKGTRAGKWHREKKYSNQSRQGGWQMLEKSWEKPVVLSDSLVLKIHILLSERFCLTCTRDKNSNLSDKGMCRGTLAEWVLPSLVKDGTRKRAATASFQSHPSPWGVGDSVACSSLHFGRRRMWRRELLCRGWATQRRL